MFELFKAELLRFRLWALAIAVAHFIALGFLTRIVDLAQQPLVIHWSFGAVYAVLGLLLGLYQMGTYRKPSTWLNLLHRPLSSSRIAVSLILAAVALLAATVALPILLVGLWQETMTARVVDLRHWLLALAALQIATAGYLVGAYGMLGERRYSAAAIVFLLLLITSKAQGFGALAVQALVVVWLIAMVLTTFKPDLDAPPRRIVGLVAVALPLQMAMYLLMLLTYSGVEMLWIAQGSHPNNMSTPPRGGHNEVEKADERTRMRMALEGSTHPDAPLLREQIALSEPIGIASQIRRIPQRFELANVAPMEFDDDARGVRWVFSHDDMRMHGYRLNDRTAAGTLGIGINNTAFLVPALPVGGLPGFTKGDAMLVAGNTAYHYSSESGQVLPRVRLPEDEQLVGVSPVGETIGVISDRALYFFDGREAIEHLQVMTPRLRVPIPGSYFDIYNLEMIELVDGYLIVFSNSYNAHAEVSALPYQHVLRVRDDGAIETIAKRRLNYDYPALYRFQSFWTSPMLYALSNRAEYLLAPPLPLESSVSAPTPRSMWLVAAALSVLALFGALWRTRRLALPTSVRVVWIVTCGLIGLPGLAALWLLYRPQECVASETAGIPAQRAA